MYTHAPFPTARAIRPVLCVALAASLFAVSGCSGNSSPRPVAGAITFSNANGTAQTPLKQLSSGESTYLDVTLVNDASSLGADWSAFCGSTPAPGTPLPPGQTQDTTCGTFTPGHTLSGPVPSSSPNGTGYVTLYTAPAAIPKGGTVTLYATPTGDRSQSSTVMLTIAALAVSVQLAPAPPATLAVSTTTDIRAVVNNDAMNGGVTWTLLCASTDCGSVNPAKTNGGAATAYTAPAAVPNGGGNVQITATSVTDPTKAVSASVTITAN